MRGEASYTIFRSEDYYCMAFIELQTSKVHLHHLTIMRTIQLFVPNALLLCGKLLYQHIQQLRNKSYQRKHFL